MSESAYLVCKSRGMTMGLGKPLRSADRREVFRFSSGPEFVPPNSEQADLTRALWKFLAQSAGAPIVVRTSYDDDFDEFVAYPVIGGDAEDGDVPFEDYLTSFEG